MCALGMFWTVLENLCDGERTYEKTIVGVEFFY